MDLQFKHEDDQLYVLNGKDWLKVDLNGSNTFTINNHIYSAKYQDGLPISAVIVSTDESYSEVLEFDEGMLRSRFINGKIFHYLHNVFLGETVEGEVKDVNMRGRKRATINHSTELVNYEVIDDKFFWLLQLDPLYSPSASPNAPFIFDQYFKFYKDIQVEPLDIKEFHVNGVRWTTVDSFIDGIVNYGKRYNAIVTKSCIEEETVDSTTYIYNEGKVLSHITVDGVRQQSEYGFMNDDKYINGFIKTGTGQYPPRLDQLRFNIPLSNPDDSVRKHVRLTLPWSSFK